MKKLVVNRVAILGAGVMGAQIAAHFANCNHEVLLYDLDSRSSDALKILQKLKPSPLASIAVLDNIKCCNYNDDLQQLKTCDWVIEAVAEDINIKSDLYNLINSHLNSHAIFTSNTSGLSINNLAEILIDSDNNLHQRFFGVHFFNPPRYQKLVELIPSVHTDLKLLDFTEDYLVRYLGKGVVRAKDTPNFIANRIGVFAMLATMHYAEEFKLDFDLVDALTGELIGRPKSGTYRLADVVGLDTLAHVVNTMTDQCKDDPWHEIFKLPTYYTSLISNGALGQKTGKGFYFKDKNGINVFSIEQNKYISADVKGTKLDQNLCKILSNKNIDEKINQLRQYEHPQAQFLWSLYREVWHYCAYHLNDIAESVTSIDNAIEWGFGWTSGPFKEWQNSGYEKVLEFINDDIASNKSITKQPIPKLISTNKPYNNHGQGFNLILEDYSDISKLPTYKRHANKFGQKIILENDSAKLWQVTDNDLLGRHADKLVFSFKTKLNVVNTELLSLLLESIDFIENSDNYTSLVIWQENNTNFSAGADLTGFIDCIEQNDFATMDRALKLIQDTGRRLKYSTIPTVAAVNGLAIGGGCEVMMHCDRVVASLESYIGLVEVGVGVIPAGGGCKEMILRANQEFAALQNNNVVVNCDKLLEYYYTNIAKAQVSTSSVDALAKGYLRKTDLIITNKEELLYSALETAEHMLSLNYRPQVEHHISCSGERLLGNLKSILANYKQGGFISDYDHTILSALAMVFSGSGVSVGEYVTEQWLLDKEREEFLKLLANSETKDRISFMLAKGKPLRN